MITPEFSKVSFEVKCQLIILSLKRISICILNWRAEAKTCSCVIHYAHYLMKFHAAIKDVRCVPAVQCTVATLSQACRQYTLLRSHNITLEFGPVW